MSRTTNCIFGATYFEKKMIIAHRGTHCSYSDNRNNGEYVFTPQMQLKSQLF